MGTVNISRQTNNIIFLLKKLLNTKYNPFLQGNVGEERFDVKTGHD